MSFPDDEPRTYPAERRRLFWNPRYLLEPEPTDEEWEEAAEEERDWARAEARDDRVEPVRRTER